MTGLTLSKDTAAMRENQAVDPRTYDEDYFEHGVQTQKSGYQNYSWLPELTIKMAHHLIQLLPIKHGEKVLDYGCAKGFLVKALRLLDVDAYGVDVSDYAIDRVDPQVRGLCTRIAGPQDTLCFNRDYDWLVSKDVFEHLTEPQLVELLQGARGRIKHMFSAIPIGRDDGTGFVIPEYDRDVTHVTVRPLHWWITLFQENGWNVDSATHSFRGVKDSWTAAWPHGNAFFVLSRR
jgi:SAM-dependent methyltransferase